MPTFSVAETIEKSEDEDKDLRQMALYDLYQELQKENFKLDDTSQKQLAEVVLRLLHDTLSEVQSWAVKCLAPFVKKLSKQQLEDSCTRLAKSIVETDEQKRDIASIALKTVISQLPIEHADISIRILVPKIQEALKQGTPEITQTALDLLFEILKRFGPLLSASHKSLQTQIVQQLTSSSPAVRKRAINTLAVLSVYSNDQIFNDLITKTVLTGIEKSSAEGGADLKTYIQCTSSIAKHAGFRLGKHLDKIISLLLKAAEDISEKEEEDESEDEVREFIMLAFDSFVNRCPEEVKSHIDFILILCKEYLEYDPNYSYDDEESDEEMEEPEDEDEDDEMEDGEFSDDDDISWRVRKAAAKCLVSLVRTRPELLKHFYNELLEDETFELTSRFKEREDTVKLHIFEILKSLLNQSITITTTSTGEQIVHKKDALSYIEKFKARIVRRLRKQLKTRNSNVKLGVYSLLSALVVSLQGGLDQDIGPLLVNVEKNLQQASEQDVQLKIEILQFLKICFEKHKPDVFKPHLQSITKTVYNRIDDKYYKITAEALRVASEMIRIIQASKDSSSYQRLVDDLFTQIDQKLQVQDIDQDVKESSIVAMCRFIAELGGETKCNINQALSTLLDRLRNEITRLITCRAIEQIAVSGYNISGILSPLVQELSSYLRKFDRPLRQSSLSTLRILVKSYPEKIDQKLGTEMVDELTQLVSDSDLHLAHLSIDLAVQVIESKPSTTKHVQSKVLPQVLSLLQSSTLQGSALKSTLIFLQTIEKDIGFQPLLKSVLKVTELTDESVSRQVFTNLGKAVAALSQKANDSDRDSTISAFLKDLKSKQDKPKVLALFTLGEIGLTTDLGSVEKEILSCLSSNSEQIKHAASFSLGNIAVGNMEKYMPLILGEIKKNAGQRYLLLLSLKEIVTQAPSDSLKKYTTNILPLLFDNASNEEESVRNVVSECLGKLATIDYDNVLPKLKEMLSGDDHQKATAVGAAKYTISENVRPFDAKLKKDLADFLKLLNSQESVSVRRSCVLLLTNAVHNKPALVDESLDSYLPPLYRQTVYDQSLVKTVDLGLLKYTTDEGLELRKSAFDCMDTILKGRLAQRIDSSKFIAELPHGAEDKDNDIKLLSYSIITKCAQLYPRDLILQANNIIPKISKQITKKLSEKALDQEKRTQEELVKSGLKTIHAFSKLNGIENVASFTDIQSKVISATPHLKSLYQVLTQEDEVAMVVSQ